MSGTRVLLVEDERIVALHSKQQLNKLGYDVVAIAASGRDALQKISELRPDIVLMDIHIEGDLDGVETAALIPHDLKTAVIYVTAFSEEATLERARATSPYGYLIKPYSERELHATIQVALERQRADSALLASEERFRSIFNAVSEGIFIADAEGILVDCNDPGAAMLGYRKEELVGKSVGALSSGIPPYTEQIAAETTARLAAAGKPMRLDWQSKTKDGRIFPTYVSLRFTRIDGRDVVLALVRDMTEQRTIEQQLQQSQKMEAIGSLTGGMAHDFNNLLGLVIGNLDMLRDRLSSDPESDLFADRALSAALRGAELTKRLLAFARRQPLQPRLVNVNEVIHGLSELLGRTLGENVEIRSSLNPDIWPIVVDPAQFEACLVNLITNARDAMPDGGEVLITTHNRVLDVDYAATHPDVSPGEYALIEITDSGVGMDEKTLARIFEPFFTTKEEGRGTGLGLSMVFGFIKQSAGHISVYSEPGSGSTFRIYLPRSRENASTIPQERDAELRDGGGVRILVVEDNPGFRTLVVEQLTQLGYECTVAADGASAIRMLEEAQPDLVFSDVIMPGGVSGHDLAEFVKRRWPTVKMLLTSGFPEEKSRGRGVSPLAVRLLSKPYRKDELARVVREVLGSS